MPANPRDFLLNTDYEMDKIVLFKEGSFTSTKDITHELPFIPLAFGVWSTSSNFSSVNTIGKIEDFTGPPSTYTPPMGVFCQVDTTKIHLESRGNSNNQTIYYRLYAFEPSDSTANVPETSSNSDTFIFNTDYNYSKLMHAGDFTSDNQEYTHNLGYIPQVMAWYKATLGTATWVSPIVTGDADGARLIVTTTKIKITGLSSTVINKIYWRIYYDEA